MKKHLTLLAAGMIATAVMAVETAPNAAKNDVTLEEAAQPKAVKSEAKADEKKADAKKKEAKSEKKVEVKKDEPKPMKVDLGKFVITTDNDKFSYAAGLDMANSILQFKDNLSLSAYFAGFESVINGRTAKMSPEDSKKAIEATIDIYRKKDQVRQDSVLTANKLAGEKWLAENAKRPEVKTTASGLQYEIVKDSTGFEQVGVGDSPSVEDEVTVNYRGTTIDGKEFDSSYKRGEPASFAVNRVIPGWTEGLQLMKTGGVFKFYIPSNLAYGEQGAGANIPPHSALIFEVELLGLSKTMAMKTPEVKSDEAAASTGAAKPAK